MKKLLAMLTTAVLAAPAAAPAAVIFSNLGADDGGNYATNSDEVGGAFTTTSSLTNNLLESVTVRYAHQENETGLSATIELWAHDAANDAPVTTGSALASATVSFDGGDNALSAAYSGSNVAGSESFFTDVTATFSSPVALSPDTTYWVVASSSNTTVFRAQIDATIDTSEATFFTWDGNRGRFGVDPANGDAGTPSSFGPQFELNAIPEPASLALLGMGGLMMLRRRQ